MRKEKRHIWQPVLGLILLLTFMFITIKYSPTFPFVLLGLAMIGGSIWLFSKFLLKDKIQATLVSITFVSYLLVRALGLKDLLFAILFLILFVTLELFFKRS